MTFVIRMTTSDDPVYLRRTLIDESVRDIEELNRAWPRPASINSAMFRAWVRSYLVNLHDLLKMAKAEGIEIEVPEPVSPEKTIADFVRVCRDAACHLDSGRAHEGNNRIAWTVAVGRQALVDVGGRIIGSDHESDITCFFGEHRLLLENHLLEAYRRVRAALPADLSIDWVAGKV